MKNNNLTSKRNSRAEFGNAELDNEYTITYEYVYI